MTDVNLQLATVCNLFPLEVVQKCQHCQLGRCLLQKNSIGRDLRF